MVEEKSHLGLSQERDAVCHDIAISQPQKCDLVRWRNLSTGWCKTHQTAMLTEPLPKVPGQTQGPGVRLYPRQLLGQKAGQRQHREPSGGMGVCNIMPWLHNGSQLNGNQQCHAAVQQSAMEQRVSIAMLHLSSAQQPQAERGIAVPRLGDALREDRG